MNPKNLGKSKAETARLSEENRLMEIRLQELKLAMDKEKKARSAQSQQGFWQSAQDNKLAVNHSSEVLKKNMRQYEKPRASRVRKVKVLKDEPIVLPSRPPPVTDDIKRIMKKELPKESKEANLKAKKCGQCEMKSAAVICQDCGENYCPSCFASFHLKGALKKHRSVPIQALGARQSPRMPFLPKPPPVSYHENEKSPGNEVAIVQKTPNKVHFEGPSLLDGEYDERANATEFAAALSAWRTGKAAGGDQTPNTPSLSGKTPPSRDPVRNSSTSQATQSPRYSIEVKGTSTDDSKPLKIEFHQSELSYADKLLLRKHRRDPVEAMPVTSPRPMPTVAVERKSEPEDLSERSEGIDFQSLYEVSCHSPMMTSGSTDDVSVTSHIAIEDVSSMMDVSTIEQVASYQVEEEPGMVEFVNEKNAKNDQVSQKAKNDKEMTPVVRKSSAKSATSPQKSARNSINGRPSSNLRKTWDKEPTLSVDKLPDVDGSRKPPVPDTKKNLKAKPEMEKTKPSPNAANSRTSRMDECDKLEFHQREKSDLKSRKSNASPRPKSRSAATPRSTRPNSRQARALLRESLCEGILTKKPSSALSAVATRETSDTDRYRGLGDVLTLGVKPVQQDRVLVARTRTPRSARDVRRSQTVSYKLYALGPKSWRPNSALSQTVPDEQFTGHDYNLDLADPAAEVDDDVTREIRALEVIGSVGLNIVDDKLSDEKNDCGSESPASLDQSQALYLSPRFRESVQSDSSTDEALQRLAEPDTPGEVEESTGRVSRMIVVDGDDMTEYDNDKYIDARLEPDVEDDDTTLEQLEWELASMTGRITAEGKLSRLELQSSQDSAVSSSSSCSSQQNMDSTREIDLTLKNDAVGFDELETQISDELEVRALQ